jgi:hypothetical protein
MAGKKHPRLTDEALQEAIIEASRCVASRRHMLEPIPPPPETPRPEFGQMFVQRCVQCGTLTYDKVSRISGERLAPRQYEKPVWYVQALAEGQDAAWWRATYWDTLGSEYFLEPERNVTPIRGKQRAS